MDDADQEIQKKYVMAKQFLTRVKFVVNYRAKDTDRYQKYQMFMGQPGDPGVPSVPLARPVNKPGMK